MVVCSVAPFFAAVLLAVFSLVPYIQARKLCEIIRAGNTKDAVAYSEKIWNVNAYSAPLMFRWFYNIVGEDIQLPLVEACKAGNYDVTVALLKRGADPNRYLDGNRSPIEATAVSGAENRLDIITQLLEYGANVDACGSGHSALFVELRSYMYRRAYSDTDIHNTQQILLLLLRYGAAPSDDRGNTILHYLAGASDSLLLQVFTKQYPELVNEQNHKGETPLHWAINRGVADNATCLINNGASPNLVDQ